MRGFCHSFGTVGAEIGHVGLEQLLEVFCFLWSSGATRRDRTGDLLITNQPLYQLS